VSDATGLYRFGLLDVGTYRLEIEAGGFKKSVRDGILLETGETTTLNVTMELGQLTESVSVTGRARCFARKPARSALPSIRR